MGKKAKAFFTDGSIVTFHKDSVKYSGKYPATHGDLFLNDICIIQLPDRVDRNFINIHTGANIPEMLYIIGLDRTGLVHQQAYPIVLYKLEVERYDFCDVDRPELGDMEIKSQTEIRVIKLIIFKSFSLICKLTTIFSLGGPLVYYDDNKIPYLLGIASYDYTDREPHQGNVNSNIIKCIHMCDTSLLFTAVYTNVMNYDKLFREYID